jgi:hypothetical protein
MTRMAACKQLICLFVMPNRTCHYASSPPPPSSLSSTHTYPMPPLSIFKARRHDAQQAPPARWRRSARPHGAQCPASRCGARSGQEHNRRGAGDTGLAKGRNALSSLPLASGCGSSWPSILPLWCLLKSLNRFTHNLKRVV